MGTCKLEFGKEQLVQIGNAEHFLLFEAFNCTWLGYNLQAELHCAIRLYSLIEEAVIRVKLTRI